MAKLIRLRSLFVIGRASVIVGAILWFLMSNVFPHIRESKVLERDIEQATLNMSDRLKTLTQVRSVLEFEEGTFKTHSQDVLRAFPPEAQVSELYQSISSTVATTGLRLLSCTIGKEEKVPLLPDSAGITTYRIPVDVEAAGKIRTLAVLADHLCASARLLAVQEVAMRRDENYLPDSVLRVRLYAFYFDPPAGMLPLAEEK
ncbi:MAG: type 4a pilus biogenesis protein PilO [Planctomycetes bacterium]|nr:type 4a pilus biogenesis protein PilO [Planctomycetota bacterium]MBI3847559.1 type 4a pilus biogenesis protein PilO [Planctomycetota bacterium]